jgi:hypothetical protein
VLVGLLTAGLLLAACGPEASRARSGGPGADVGNHGATIEMHGGLCPYYRTPAVGKGVGE